MAFPAFFSKTDGFPRYLAFPLAWVKRRGVVRFLLKGFFAAYLLFVVLALILRYGVLPEIGRYQHEIEGAASRALELPVTIGALEGGWVGLNPAIRLKDVRIFDKEGEPALVLERVEGVLSWYSLLTLFKGEPRFSLLYLERPALRVYRNKAGNIFVAGVFAAPQETEGVDIGHSGLDWLFGQSRIRILDAAIFWEDRLRNAPPLALRRVNFELKNQGNRHRFGFSALPDASLASSLDIRGDFRGGADEPLKDWRGQLYARLDYTDLAAWKPWVDYPAHLPQGEGGIRFWIDKTGGKAGKWSALADLSLRNARFSLGDQLPEMNLRHLDGRLEFAQAPGYLEVATRKLSLSTESGITVPPLNLDFEWRGEPGEPGEGFLKAEDINLSALSRLAAYLPLPSYGRELLERHQPGGRVRQLGLSWKARGGQWEKYSVKAAFSDLGILAHGIFPGAKGLSGTIEANEKKGMLRLKAGNAALFLPMVFAEPDIPLDAINARASWELVPDKKEPGTKNLTVNIQQLSFSSPHAAGNLSGIYRSIPDEPGYIDIKGELSRARAIDVWRYIPKAVHPEVPAWLRQALVSGNGSNGHLILKGDLKHFPFYDPAHGQFLITAQAHNVKLNYGNGWPAVEELEADMKFGSGMWVKAKKGRILGAKIEEALTEIPDFAADDPMLNVQGKVAGATGEFLKFIGQSPVSASINHFTEGMSAQGQGSLALNLELPLEHVEDSRVKGRYLFEGNQVSFIEGIPPAMNTQGFLDFTENSITIPGLSARFMGQPMQLSANSENGKVLIRANGGFTALALRQHLNLDIFSGAASWQAEVAVKQNVDFQFASTLQGMALNLPVPLRKNAAENMPLLARITTQNDPNGAAREQISFQLGKVMEGQLERSLKGNDFVLERGVVGIGQSVKMPAKGVSFFINTQETLNLDDWKVLLSAFDPETQNTPAAAKPARTFPLDLIAVNARKMTLMGLSFSDMGLRVMPEGGTPRGWRALAASKEMVGELIWDARHEGTISAKLNRLHLIADKTAGQDATGEKPGAPPSAGNLPGMDIRVEDFRVGERRLGHLEIKAENAGGRWNLRQILIDNPDGKLTGSGLWDVASQHSRLDFSLSTPDSGKLLERMGYSGIVKGGNAKLNGALDWNGSPIAFDPATLGGALRMEASKGQFSKVEPGVGKILGLLSLQSIGRRLAFDFRDIFSDGFAYDSILASVNIKNGIMKTDEPLRINAPSGEILMQGIVDMKQETQDLDVTVQPEIGSVAAVGTAIAINPVVGAAALLAQSLLKNPLNKVFSLHYKITGSWDNPLVEKKSITPTPAPAVPKEGMPEPAAGKTPEVSLKSPLPLQETSLPPALSPEAPQTGG